jgi:hypothetical protein
MAAPVDDSPGLRSVRVAGNSSGDISRAAGSSFAAPQVARALAQGAVRASPALAPGQPPDPARLGAGILPVE